MPSQITYTTMGQFALGGIATLCKIVLEDGRQALLRELQSSKLLSWKHQRNFRRGTAVRECLSPHPNVANSIERGVKGLMRPYEIIEYVEGRNLKAIYNARDPMLQKHLVFIISECAEALAWVHANALMHLDVKPENFLVRNTEENPVIKLTDFDLAQKASCTAPHRQMGTPAYMAPEQFKHKTACQASDVFAFSIMAYQLATGKQPFTGNTQKEALKKQISSSFMPPAPCDFNHELPMGLSDAIMAGLEKKQQNRLPNMQAFLAYMRS